MTIRQARSYCRICSAHCGMVLSIDDGLNRIVDVKADKDNPMSNGYVCVKGLQAEEAHHGPARLLRPLKRQADGGFAEIGSEQALDEIAARMRAILDADGPQAIATFKGTQGTLFATHQIQHDFLTAIGSKQFYSTNTVDQSAKMVSFERQGGWAAGPQDVATSDVLLLIGANPIVSHSTMPVISPDPLRILRKEKERGLKLICIDPRRTETAHHADLFLQPLPGRDAGIAAALIRLILDEGWQDSEFVAHHVGADRIAELRKAVDPFTEEMVEASAGLEAGQLRAAAAMFARDSKRGGAFCSTGPCMAGFSNLTQHLVDTLNIVCGRFRRAGEKAVVDVALPELTRHAEVIAPRRSWQAHPESRIRGVGQLGIDRLASTLAEEILTPGPGQIRALIVQGGNPAVCLPDQDKVFAALEAIDLLVVVDPYMTATARFADYVLPPTMMYERFDLPISTAGFPPLLPVSWTQLAEPVLKHPEGSDLIEDWYVYWALAKRLGVQIAFHGVPLDMDEPPTTEGLIATRLAGAQISFDQLREDLKSHPAGKIYELPSAVVQPPSGSNARFDVMPDDVADELARFGRSVMASAAEAGGGFSHLLISRRLNAVMNTLGTNLQGILRNMPDNPAYLSPDDLDALGLEPGDEVEIVSEHGRIEAAVQPDKTMRRGIVSVAHCWGGTPDKPGVNVNRLVSTTDVVEPINAMPRMSAIPVNIRKVAEAEVAV